MGFIPQITCRHCGNQYLGTRSRCPNCGTRRVQQSNRPVDSTDASRRGTSANAVAAENTKWQFILGVILLVAVIISVIILISASLGSGEEADAVISPTSDIVSEAPSPSPTPSPSPSPEPVVISISVTYGGSPTSGFTTGIGSAYEIQLKGQIYPLDSTGVITWTSSNDEIATVDQTGLVKGVSPGSVTITAECAGVKTDINVIIKQSVSW